MKKIAFFSDLIFTFSISGIFTLVLFRYLKIPLFLALLLAVLCGGLTALAVSCLTRLRKNKRIVKAKSEEEKQKLLLHLALLSDEEKTEFFKVALSTPDDPLGRFGRLRLFSKTEFYFLKFSLTPLSADEIPNLARLKTGKNKVLLCAQIEEDALRLCSRLHIEVRTGEWVYDRLREKNALPERFLGDKSDAPNPPKRRRLWFAKRNAKRFLLGGGLILLLSRLSPFTYYYLAAGCILLCASAFIRIFGYE